VVHIWEWVRRLEGLWWVCAMVCGCFGHVLGIESFARFESIVFEEGFEDGAWLIVKNDFLAW
jgi:hypothetical protein